jgi:segregation and condensation protein B
MERDERKKVLELLLWMTDRPLKATEIIHIIGDTAFTEIELREDLRAVGRELDERQAPYHVVEVAHGFQFASRPAFSQWVRKLYKEKTALRLSPSALETLSIVAYKQPLTRGEIEDIRGVDVSGTLETLLERKLVKIVGRKEALGRPMLFGTTMDFMKQFGLRSLDELPRLEELVPPDDAGAFAPLPQTANANTIEPVPVSPDPQLAFVPANDVSLEKEANASHA